MNYINITHKKKVYLVTGPTFSDLSEYWPQLLNKLFSYERYWCNSFRFMFRALDLYKKISISMKSGVVNFSASLLWNLNFKMVVVSFCARYSQNIGAIFYVSPNYKSYQWYRLIFQNFQIRLTLVLNLIEYVFTLLLDNYLSHICNSLFHLFYIWILNSILHNSLI